jgi:hypothetical protein
MSSQNIAADGGTGTLAVTDGSGVPLGTRDGVGGLALGTVACLGARLRHG